MPACAALRAPTSLVPSPHIMVARPRARSARTQGLALVHFSAHCKRFRLNRGCMLGVFSGCLGV